jgi:hypothetical protein
VYDEGGSNTNLVQKKNSHAAHNKKKNKSAIKPKVANFKKKSKGKGACFVCDGSNHWAKECQDYKDK